MKHGRTPSQVFSFSTTVKVRMPPLLDVNACVDDEDDDNDDDVDDEDEDEGEDGRETATGKRDWVLAPTTGVEAT